MPIPSLDTGFVRWYVFIPGQGRFVIPPEVAGPERAAWALSQGATRMFCGNQLVWTRPVVSGGHLAVVRD